MCKLEQYIVRETTWVLNIFFFSSSFSFAWRVSQSREKALTISLQKGPINTRPAKAFVSITHKRGMIQSTCRHAGERAGHELIFMAGMRVIFSKGGDKDSYLFWLLRVQLQQIDFRHWEMLSKHHQHSASSQCHQSLGVLGWPLQLSLQRTSWPQ